MDRNLGSSEGFGRVMRLTIVRLVPMTGVRLYSLVLVNILVMEDPETVVAD